MSVGVPGPFCITCKYNSLGVGDNGLPENYCTRLRKAEDIVDLVTGSSMPVQGTLLVCRVERYSDDPSACGLIGRNYLPKS